MRPRVRPRILFAMPTPSPVASPDNWAETLAHFLRQTPGVEAIRLNPASGRIAIATLGDVDLKTLERQLAETIALVDRNLISTTAPSGFTVRRDGAQAELSVQSCATAPKFWQWREFAWPEPAIGAADEVEFSEESEWRELAILALVCGVFGIAGKLVGHFAVAPGWVQTSLYAVALIAGGWDAAIDTWANIRARKLDIHFLMLAVAIGAVSIGAWGEAVLLLFLFSASGAMEEYALDRTQREVGSLLKSAPKQASLVMPDGRERTVSLDELGIGDLVRVKPGEAFAADGLVRKGKSASDESALTGEAQPVAKTIGDEVFSGTLNLWGIVDFEVRKLPSESTLQKIIRLIHTAQKLRAPSERFTDKFGATYTIAVLGATAAMFLLWWLVFHLPPFHSTPETRSAFYRAMTLLVVTSPCALVLSIPSAILSAIAYGAKHGILFRGGAAIEGLAEVTVVALDKTGTLTTGELAVDRCESFPPGREQQVLELAFALEVNSQHPLARAIVRHARANGVKERDADDFQSLTGRGLRGRVDGAQVLLGRRELLTEGPLADWAKSLPPAPPELSEVWIIGKDLVGRILLRDQIRAESKGVLEALRRSGLRTVMLTGDHRHAAENVAKQIGLDEVRSGLSPEGKVAAIQEFRAQGAKIAMVGDGVNDAPSLAAADVAVAMGARGSDAALEQAAVILMDDRIENFLAARTLSLRARAIIRQNLAISLGVVVLMAIASIIGWVPLAVGVAAHEGSTVVVCLNSLRLLFGKQQ